MSLVENMDGTQCGEALMLYMEGIATIVIHVLIIIAIGISILASSCCLVGLQ